MLYEFLLIVLLFKMFHEYGVVVLPGVPKCKEAGRCLMEKIHVLDKLRSGMSYDALG